MLEKIVLALYPLILGEGHGQAELREEELDLLNGLRLPLLQFVDAGLHVHVFIRQVSLS